jgi:hypothetical protein
VTRLKASTLKNLPKAAFGLPEERKYPMPDREHAANAKARAAQEEERGLLSSRGKKKIDHKAEIILARTAGK